MKLSFDDEESFKEAAGSLHFYNPPSANDPNSFQQVGFESSGSMSPQERKDDDICFDNPQSDPNIILQVRRVVGSNGSSSVPPQERSEDI